jgi:phage terminase small subunit
MASNDNN